MVVSLSVVYPHDCIAAQKLWLPATDEHLERMYHMALA